MADYGEIFSKKVCLILLETISECLVCRTAADAKKIVDNVGELIGFDHALYGLAKLDPGGRPTDYEILNFSFPSDWIEIYRSKNFHLVDPIVKENFRSFGVQYWGDTYARHKVDAEFLSASREFGLVHGYAGGLINCSGTEGSIFSVSGSIKKDPHHEAVLKKLVPHLDRAFKAVLATEKKPRMTSTLSRREKEVLNWVKRGKTSWDISAILDISERTVKFHIDNVMRKLDAVSRLHAVAVALSVGLIDAD